MIPEGYSSLVSFGLMESLNMNANVEQVHKERIDHILREFELSRQYPRKKKKAVRKQLNKSYSLEMTMKKWHDSLNIFANKPNS